MTAIVPLRTDPIVEVNKEGGTTGRMTQRLAAFLAALAKGDGLSIGSVSGASYQFDGIPSDRATVRLTFDLVPATDGDDLWLLARTAAGDVTAYAWAWPYNDGAATAAADTDTSDTQIVLAKAVQNDALVGGVSGVVEIHNIQSARYKRVTGRLSHFDSARERSTSPAGRINTASPITGVRIQFSTGAIASGHARLEAA